MKFPFQVVSQLYYFAATILIVFCAEAAEKSNFDRYIDSIKALDRSPWQSMHASDGLIRTFNKEGTLFSFGTGTFTQDPETGKKYIITAQHVVSELFTTRSKDFSVVVSFPHKPKIKYQVIEAFAPSVNVISALKEFSLIIRGYLGKCSCEEVKCLLQEVDTFDDIAFLFLEDYPKDIKPALIATNVKQFFNKDDQYFTYSGFGGIIRPTDSLDFPSMFEGDIPPKSMNVVKRVDTIFLSPHLQQDVFGTLLTGKAYFSTYKKLGDKGIMALSRPGAQGFSGTTLRNNSGEIVAVVTGANLSRGSIMEAMGIHITHRILVPLIEFPIVNAILSCLTYNIVYSYSRETELPEILAAYLIPASFALAVSIWCYVTAKKFSSQYPFVRTVYTAVSPWKSTISSIVRSDENRAATAKALGLQYYHR